MIHRVTRQQAQSENLRPVWGLQIQQFSVRLSLAAHLSRFTPATQHTQHVFNLLQQV